ncbi:retrovirus-related pol polyprotein from transposon TNT 1-94 [Tanacetum coccineum]
MGNDSQYKVVGIGKIQIKMHDGVVRTLTDLYHVSDLKKNFISLNVLDLKGFKYRSKDSVLFVSKDALVVMKVTKGTSSLYTLQGETITGSASVSCLKKSNSYLTMLLHMRRGHMSEKGMVILSKRELLDNHKVFMMKHKSKTFEKFKHWNILIENQTRRKIKSLHIVNGLEFCSKECNDFCRDEGIARHYTLRYTPQQTRSPATAIDCKTTILVWSGKLANYLKLRVFRCPTYYHTNEGKLDLRCEKGILMGYNDGVKGYRILSSSERRVIFSRDVEHVVPDDTDHNVTSPDDHTYSSHLEYEKDRSIAHNRPSRNAKAPSLFGFEDYVAYTLQVAKEVEFFVSIIYREAITSKDSHMWIAALGEEINLFIRTRHGNWSNYPKEEKLLVVSGFLR